LRRRTQLADENEVQGRVERPSNLEGDRNTSTRQRDHNGIPDVQISQRAGKLTAGVGSIREPRFPSHADSVALCALGRRGPTVLFR
jgi:hypothetical protein